jgi:hypothetical protein
MDGPEGRGGIPATGLTVVFEPDEPSLEWVLSILTIVIATDWKALCLYMDSPAIPSAHGLPK